MRLKGTGLGLAPGQCSSQQAMSHVGFGAPGHARFPGQQLLLCSREDLTRLEDALGGLAALEAIDLSENGALGTSGVGRLVSSCAGELIDFVILFCALSVLGCDVVLQRACAVCSLEGARGCCPRV